MCDSGSSTQLNVGMLIAIHSNTPLVVNTTNNTTPTVNTTVTQNKPQHLQLKLHQ